MRKVLRISIRWPTTESWPKDWSILAFRAKFSPGGEKKSHVAENLENSFWNPVSLRRYAILWSLAHQIWASGLVLLSLKVDICEISDLFSRNSKIGRKSICEFQVKLSSCAIATKGVTIAQHTYHPQLTHSSHSVQRAQCTHIVHTKPTVHEQTA